MYTEAQLQAHADLLAEKVFQTETRWPHFRLLLRNIRDWGKRLPEGATVVSLERTLLYGGISLVAPFFFRQKFVSVDSSPESADKRGDYNRAMVDDPRCLRVPLTRRAPIERTGLDDSAPAKSPTSMALPGSSRRPSSTSPAATLPWSR